MASDPGDLLTVDYERKTIDPVAPAASVRFDVFCPVSRSLSFSKALASTTTSTIALSARYKPVKVNDYESAIRSGGAPGQVRMAEEHGQQLTSGGVESNLTICDQAGRPIGKTLATIEM